MFEAKSIFFGGNIVEAKNCDYESSKKLGLICPFCNSAVFLRSEFKREIKDKVQNVKKHFVHYHTERARDCEKRYLTKEGKKEIERIKTEARNQRLIFFNRYLWDMIKESSLSTNQKMNKVRSLIGERWVEEQTKLIKLKLRNFKEIEKIIRNAVDDVYNLCKLKSPSHYILKCDLEKHINICLEVCNFLSTDTGELCLNKVFKVALYETLELNIMSPRLLKTLGADRYIVYVSIVIAGTEWIELIDQRLNI